MGEKMSLQAHVKFLRQAASEIRRDGHNGWGNTCEFAADAIDAHLATPAQTVDVEAVRAVSKQLKCTDETGLAAEPCYQLGDKLSQAIGDKT